MLSRAEVDAIYEPLLARVVVERACMLRVGNPSQDDVQVGPVVDAAAERKILEYIELGKDEAAKVLGGSKLARPGYFIEPTIFADVPPRARLALEELYGPVLAFIPARDFDDALAIANRTQFGLTGSVYSTRSDRRARATNEFHVGKVYFNRKSTGAFMGARPFGGFNMSGTDSKAGGPDYLLFFLQGKSLGVRRM